MSPEYNFHIKVRLDLRSDGEALLTASSFSRVLQGVQNVDFTLAEPEAPLELPQELQTDEIKSMNFGQALARLRTMEGLTQREVARRAKIDPCTLSRMERDSTRHRARGTTLARILGSFGWERSDPRITLLTTKASLDHLDSLSRTFVDHSTS